MKYETTLTINKPVDAVFHYFTNPANLKLWLTNFKKYHALKGEPGQVGSTAKHQYEERGKLVELVETITRRTENQELSGTYVLPSMHSTISTKFESQGSTTRLHVSVTVTFTSFFTKLFGPLMAGKVKSRQLHDLQRFKDLVESH